MDVSSIAAQGLAAAQTNFQKAAVQLSAAPSDTVDLSSAAVNLLSARTQFDANIRVLKLANEMDRQAINLLA